MLSKKIISKKIIDWGPVLKGVAGEELVPLKAFRISERTRGVKGIPPFMSDDSLGAFKRCTYLHRREFFRYQSKRTITPQE